MKLNAKTRIRYVTATLAVLAIFGFLMIRTLHQLRINDWLLAAVKTRDAIRVRSLLEQGADANAIDQKRTSLSIREILYNLVGRRNRPENLHTALCLALATRRPDGTSDAASSPTFTICEALLAHGAWLNIDDEQGESPLLTAMFMVTSADTDEQRKWALRLSNLFLDNGADPNAEVSGTTALDLACAYGRSDLVEHLLSKGAMINHVDAAGRTPLYLAITWNQPSVVAILLDRRASLKDEHASPPLILAVRHASPTVTRVLLDKGADVNVTDRDGKTALIVTATLMPYIDKHIRYELAFMLLRHGGNVNIADNLGKTPLYYATKYGFTDLSRLFLIHGAHVIHNDLKGR